MAHFVLNTIGFAAFGMDKGKAIARSRRLEERSSLFIALFGPFGAYAGMKLFRHKTRKLKFKLVPLFLLLHAVFIVYFLVYGVRLP